MPLSNKLSELKEIFAKNKEAILEEYCTFLKFKSISSEENYKQDCLACAEWICDYLKKIGFTVELWPTTGHPTIFASYLQAGPDEPILLIYNHYDVQPIDPIELWNFDPFEPTVSNGEMYARGAQDNKGQCFYVLLALKILIELYGGLPINIKLCIEGEEECGSRGLSHLLEQKKEELSADYLAVVDLSLPNIETPTITLGLRGIVTMDMEVQGSHSDLHSGSHGGLAFNPLHAMVKLLAMTHDHSGRVAIPGFYDDIIPVSENEKKMLALHFDEEEYKSTFGIRPTGGECKYEPNERNWLRPTLEVNGIYGGYCGNGFKTVIPAKACAKISCRLVAGQNPEKIGSLVSEFLERSAPDGVKVKIVVHPGGGTAVSAKADSRVVKAFSKAYEEIFNKKCQLIYSGASIPVITKLAQLSGAQIALVGLGLPDDQIHAPNEHFGINRIEMGFLSMARVIELLKN